MSGQDSKPTSVPIPWKRVYKPSLGYSLFGFLSGLLSGVASYFGGLSMGWLLALGVGTSMLAVASALTMGGAWRC